MSAAFDRLLAALGDRVRKRTDTKAQALCPGHPDSDPSLSISVGDDGRVLLRCFAGCTVEAICAALGITVADLFADNKRKRVEDGHASAEEAIQAALERIRRKERTLWRLAAQYPYQAAAGTEVMRILRLEPPDGSHKTFRVIHPKAGRWHDSAPKGPAPLLRLPDVIAGDRVFVCEGEKAVECAAALGLYATTSAFGASAVRRTDWTPLAGKVVILLPDNDGAGEKWTEDVGRILCGVTPPPSVRVVRLPDLPEKGDIVEFVAAQRAAGLGSEEIAGSIAAMAEAAAPFVSNGSTPPGGSEKNAGGGGLGEASSGGSGGSPWGPLADAPEPEELPDDLPPVPSFNTSLLPRAFQPWIADITDRLQCPPDYPAVAAMVALAAAVGRRVGMRPKVRDDWTVVPNLWGAIVGRPSLLKTPALQQPLKPLKRLEIEAKEVFDREMKDYEAALMVSKIAKKVKENSIKAAIKNGGDALGIAQELIGEEPERPTRVRYLLNDSTVEKLGEILNENPNGVLVYRDELSGLLRALDKEGQEGARAFYLEAWNGTGRFTYDRILRGTVDIEAAIASILGGIQPGPLADYLRRAVQNAGDDGLMARFQLTVWPDAPLTWRNVDRWPDTAARRAAHAVFDRLVHLQPEDVGAETDGDDDDEIPFLRFTPAAQEIFDRWRADLETRLRTGDEHPAIESHLAKYRSLVPSIALLIHLADGGVGPVGEGPLCQACGWAELLEPHARRMYSTVANADAHAAKALTRKILKGEIADGFTLRDVHRHGWTGLDRDAAHKAIAVLIDIDWLRTTAEQTKGRSKTRHWINPRILERGGAGTDKADESLAESDEAPTSGTDTTDESGASTDVPAEAADKTDESGAATAPDGVDDPSSDLPDGDEPADGHWGEL